MMRRAILILLVVVLLLLILLVGGSYVLLGTDSGFRWTSRQLDQVVPGLSLTATDGNLQTGVQTGQIEFQSDGLMISLGGLKTKWRSGCLFQYRFCLDELTIDTLSVRTRTDGAPSTATTTAVALPNIQLPLGIDAEDVRIGQLTLDLSADQEPIVLENVRLQGSMSGSNAEIRQLGVGWKNYMLSLAGSVSLREDYPLDLQVSLHARDILPGQHETLNLQLSNSLRQLAVNGKARGAVNTEFNGVIEPLTQSLPLSLTAQWASLGWPLPKPELVETTHGEFSVRGNLDDFAVVLKANVTGRDIPESQVELRGNVNPQRALMHTVNVLTLDGLATGSAAINWADEPLWIAEFIAKEINPGQHWADMNGRLNALLKANGRITRGNWSLNVTTAKIDGKLRNYPFTLSTRLSKSVADLWEIESLHLENGDNTLSLQGTVGHAMNLTTSINFPAIHNLVPSVVGNLQADARITGTVSEPGIELTARSSLIKIRDVLLRKLTLEGKIVDAGNGPSELALDVGIINSQGQQLTALASGIKGSRKRHEFRFSVNGPLDTRVNFTASGGLSEAFDWTGQLVRARIDVPGHPLRLADATALQWQNAAQILDIAAHCWVTNGARLCLKNSVQASTKGTAQVTLDNYALQTLNELLPGPTELSGELTTDATVNWNTTADNPFDVEWTTVIQRGAIGVTDVTDTKLSFEYKTLTLRGKADADQVVAELRLASDTLGESRVALTLNPRSPTRDIVGDVSLRGFDLGFLKAFLPRMKEIGGTLNVAGTIGGSLTEPRFNGLVSLKDPVVRSPDLPLTIDGGTLGARVDGDRASLDGKLISGDGTIKVGGNVSWLNRRLISTVTLDGDSLVIVQDPIIHSIVHPSLRIQYRPESLRVDGKIRVESADINIVKLPEGATALSPDVVIIEEARETQQADAGRKLKLTIDTDIELGKDVNLSGYGLSAKLTGDFKLSKLNEDPPQLIGEIVVNEGYYRSYGQDLSITDGQILFVGPIQQTTLDIDAVRRIESENRVAGLHLEGPISDPQVTLFTEPADKTQESILSYIVLGRDLGGDNSSEDNNLLATAALALTIKEGKGFATGFAESLGIEDFAVEAGGSGDATQVLVSGRLSPRLLLRYGRSVFVPEQTLFLRYDISRKLYLEAAQGVERAVDLFYAFSF